MSSTTRIFAAPLLLTGFPLAVPPDRVHELEHVDRLRDVTIEAGLEEPLAVASHRLRRQREHGHPRVAVVSADPVQRLDAVNPGQLHVHQDQVGRVLRGQRDGLLAGRRLDWCVSLRLENVAEQLHVLLVVLDDEDPFGGHQRDFRGIVNAKVLPAPAWLSTQMRPPCSSTSRRDSASPRPVPSGRGPSCSACWNSSKIRSWSSGAMPGPSSLTATVMTPLSRTAETPI